MKSLQWNFIVFFQKMSPVKYFFIIQVKRKPINEQKV